MCYKAVKTLQRRVRAFFVLAALLAYAVPATVQAQILTGKQVFERKCLSCHNTNHTLNFLENKTKVNLLNTMVRQVESNTMPPWYADTTFSRFANEHALNKAQKKALLTWLKSPAAKTDKLNPPKNIVRKPNLVLPIAKGYVVPGDNKDHFVIFKIPYELPHDTFVSSIEFVPHSSFKINHHLNYEIIPYNDVVDIGGTNVVEVGQSGYDKDSVYNSLGLANPFGYAPGNIYYGAWAPGMSATHYSKPFSIFMPKKGYIITRLMHYSPTPVSVSDSCYFNIYFHNGNESKNYRKMQMLQVGSNATPIVPELALQPGDKKWFKAMQTVPANIIVHSLMPHMHMLGKKLLAYATYNNDTLPLIKIDNWNFDFQENYVFPQPIVLRKGTKIFVEGYFDNTADNPQNPNIPPRFVSGKDGMLTSGEMLLLVLMYINADVADDKNIKY